MNRLTMNNGLCNMASTEFCILQKDCYFCSHGRKCFKQLAAYEDIELNPEEITTEPYGCVFYCNRKCNLDGDFCAEGPGCLHEINEEVAKHLLELAQAEEDGRLAVLPCKVGDTVWTNITIVGDRYRYADSPCPFLVVLIVMGQNGGFFHAQDSSGQVLPFDFENLGKTVFLTCEEAEVVLGNREEADNEED